MSLRSFSRSPFSIMFLASNVTPNYFLFLLQFLFFVWLLNVFWLLFWLLLQLLCWILLSVLCCFVSGIHWHLERIRFGLVFTKTQLLVKTTIYHKGHTLPHGVCVAHVCLACQTMLTLRSSTDFMMFQKPRVPDDVYSRTRTRVCLILI
jgi:hypothetical protein